MKAFYLVTLGSFTFSKCLALFFLVAYLLVTREVFSSLPTTVLSVYQTYSSLKNMIIFGEDIVQGKVMFFPLDDPS